MNEGPEPASNARRRLLAGLAAPAILGLMGWWPKDVTAAIPERTLVLQSRQLGETVRTVYYADGAYQPSGLQEIRHLFRDKHNAREVDIDPRLLDALWVIQRRLAPRSALQVICGYRSPQTNAMLRRKMRGVASNSFHMYGKAVDLRIDGCALKDLYRFALELKAGGVGYYPRSNFIHLDTGPLRSWSQGWSKRRRRA